jgi:hypothetical protein
VQKAKRPHDDDSGDDSDLLRQNKKFKGGHRDGGRNEINGTGLDQVDEVSDADLYYDDFEPLSLPQPREMEVAVSLNKDIASYMGSTDTICRQIE